MLENNLFKRDGSLTLRKKVTSITNPSKKLEIGGTKNTYPRKRSSASELRYSTIQRTVTHIKTSNASLYCSNQEERNKAIDDAVTEYHSSDATEDMKDTCRSIIVYNLYFLLLKVMEKYKFPQFLFDDAIQNSVCEILVALDKVDLSKKTKFSSYIQYYLKAAACTTAASIASIKTPYCARKKTMSLINNYYNSTGNTVSPSEVDQINAENVVGTSIKTLGSSNKLPTIDDTDAVSSPEFLDEKESNAGTSMYTGTSFEYGADTQLREERISVKSTVSSQKNKTSYVDTSTNKQGSTDKAMDPYMRDSGYDSPTMWKLNSLNEIDLNSVGSAIENCTDTQDIEELNITKEYIDILSKILQVLPSADTVMTRRKYNSTTGNAIITCEKDTYLTDKEKIVIIHRFGIFGAPQMTLEEVATFFKVRGWKASRVRILQIQQSAIGKLREYMKLKGIDYLKQ